MYVRHVDASDWYLRTLLQCFIDVVRSVARDGRSADYGITCPVVLGNLMGIT